MLEHAEIERLFQEFKTPAAGRALIRKIRAESPVRKLQGLTQHIRTRFHSKKMGRALYAESRTVELPGIFAREHDKSTLEMWPQACHLDLKVLGPEGGSTRVLHIPDLFLVTETGFVMEEWREEARLLRYSVERPHHFYKDEEGRWHYRPIEEHLQKLGIEYRLRSADEHPRIYLANLAFLEDYGLETTPPVTPEVSAKMVRLLDERKSEPLLELVHTHGFKADHIFQMVLEQSVYVDLYAQRLDVASELVVYGDKAYADAAALVRTQPVHEVPLPAARFAEGTKFLYDGKRFHVVISGASELVVRDDAGNQTVLTLDLIEKLVAKNAITVEEQKVDREASLRSLMDCKQSELSEAMARLQAVRAGSADGVSARTIYRWKEATRGLITVQEQLLALVPSRPGNHSARLPEDVVAVAERVVQEFHNKPNNPKVAHTYLKYIEACTDQSLVPMSQSTFYEWIRSRESIRERQGKRVAYQKAPIALTFDYEAPVHGVRPHEVCYVDHTVMNVFLKGMTCPDLGKPTLTLAVDGCTSQARAFYVSYDPAGFRAVLMVLRDYVRRHGRLPKTLVVDNGAEFRGDSLKLFCDLFGIHIRWRKAGQPRGAAMVERALGATEQEVLASMYGNSLNLKDPRLVTASVNPQNLIAFTLPALHGALESYLFNIHAKRIHPRFGMTPVEFEKQRLLETGAREHVLVNYDPSFMLLTSPHSGSTTRSIDRQRGVFVDGMYYWNDELAQMKPRGESVEVRVETWNASVVYVYFRDKWLVARARDGRRLEGRFRREFELQRREENRVKRTLAHRDRNTPGNARKKAALWVPEHWDARLREQQMEMHYLYAKLEMVEALPAATNPKATLLDVGLPRGSDLEHLRALAREPDAVVTPPSEPEEAAPPKPGKRNVKRTDGPPVSLKAPEASASSNPSEELEYF